MADLAQQLSVMGKALDLRVQRHQVLASNIANADTPGYKARDFDFSKAMESATGARGAGVALARTASGHLQASGGAATANLQYRKESQSAVDGNTVDMDVERAQISENSVQHQMLTFFINDSFKNMKIAISSNQS